MYLPQVIGSILGLSGILATLTAGMACRKFVFPTIELESREKVIGILKILSDFAETASFINLGLACLYYSSQQYNGPLILGSLILCAVSRPIQVKR